MSLKISLGGDSATGGLFAPFNSLTNGFGGNSRSAAERRMVAAVTGGVAICDPKASVKQVRIDAEKSEMVIAPQIDMAKLQILFDAVDKVRQDKTATPEISEADRRVAQSLGSRSRYVAAVRLAAEADSDACAAGVAWAASLNAKRLADAARLGSSTIQLERIPIVEEKTIAIEERVKKLEADFGKLKAKVDALNRVAAKAPDGAKAKTASG